MAKQKLKEKKYRCELYNSSTGGLYFVELNAASEKILSAFIEKHYYSTYMVSCEPVKPFPTILKALHLSSKPFNK